MEAEINRRTLSGSVEVSIRVRLTSREASRVFSSGDFLIRLPIDGALSTDDAPMTRDAVYLSELAESREGYRREFVTADAADAFATAVHAQLERAANRLGLP